MYLQGHDINCGFVILKMFYFRVFVAEGVQFVTDLGAVFERVVQPAVSEETQTLLDAVLMFVRFYETNEHFDLLTHGIGPGVVAVVMHSFSEFMGDLMGGRLDHGLRYSGKRIFQHMYFEKLKAVVNSIVVDEKDQYSGKLAKKADLLSAPQQAAPKKKTTSASASASTSAAASKVICVDDKSDDDEEGGEISDGQSETCSVNENDFTTLTSSDGRAYHPPKRTTVRSKYAAGKSGEEAVELMEQAASKFQKKIDSQARIISRLTAENLAARDKLKNIDGQTTPPGLATTSSNIIAAPKKQKGNKAKLHGFVSTQFVHDTGLYSDDEEMTVDLTPDADGVKPDSTQSAKASVISDDDAIIPSTQMVANKKRLRLDSGASGKSVKSRIAMPSSPAEGSDNEDSMDRLRLEKDAVKEKLVETQEKLRQQLMYNKSREYMDSVVSAIRGFRSELMECFGASKEDDRLTAARDTFAVSTTTISHFGYTFRVHDDFRERVEKSIWSGQTPEQQISAQKIDNSTSCPISGHVTDVIYEIFMPVVVKKEVDPDDDCMVLLYEPAPPNSKPVTVKTEKVDGESKDDAEEKKAEDAAASEDVKNNNQKQASSAQNSRESSMDEEEDLDVENTPTKRRRKKFGDLPPRLGLRSRQNKPE